MQLNPIITPATKTQPRIITAPLKGTDAMTLLILFGAGSRYEEPNERGIAHFLEHMFFKGGEIYDTPQKVSEAIDNIGGDFNAFTGKEYVGYYVKCASLHQQTAFSVLGDILLNTKLAQEDIDREKGVIIEELNMYQDTPMYQVGWNFERLLFGDTPLGWDQIGLPETINSFKSEDFRNYKKDLYTADNCTLLAVGAVNEKEVAELVNKHFSFNGDSKQRQKAVLPPINQEQLKVQDKNTEQAHLVLGMPGVSFNADEQLTARLLSVILGGNMSSRMFTEIREKQGLCYSISTSTDHFSDVGVLSTYCGVDLVRAEQAIAEILRVYKEVASDGITEAELIKAKGFLQGKLTLKMEDSEEVASYLGVQSILHDDQRVENVAELFTRLQAISLNDVNLLAKDILSQPAQLSMIGPFADRTEQLQELLR